MKNTSEERVEHISGLVVRSLKVTNGRNKCQEFTQYHYTNWPESLDSDNLNSLIELMLKNRPGLFLFLISEIDLLIIQCCWLLFQ